MAEAEQGDGRPDGAPPAWMPAAVGAARRRGTAGADDLHSGAAYRSLLVSLAEAGAFLHGDRVPAGGEADAAGYRHLLVLLALGIDDALRGGDPYEPAITPGNVDDVLKWGMDCPDALYVGSPVRADATYRVTGRRNSVRYLGFQVMAGIASDANVVADELHIAADGRFELWLSAEPRPGNWMPLSPRANSLVVRQFFYDWDTEVPAELEIECVDRPRPPAAPGPPDPEEEAAGTARQLEALGRFVTESLRFWWGIEELGRSQGLNVFREPAARTDMGGAAENVTVWGSWELADDEALIVEVTPPPAAYWSLALGNQWWESLDYAGRQTSLNGHQAVLDDDGAFRAVLAHRDPGVANWLDVGGHRRGPMIVRWVRAAGDPPVPATRLVPVDDVAAHLPPATRRVGPEERASVLRRRRAAVRRRFGR